MHEDMLCALLLPTNSMVAELLKSLNVYRSGKLNWSFCINICTGRAAAMTGPISGFITWVKEVASECRSLHCILHREMLTSQRTSPELNVLQDVIKIINELMFMPLTHIYSHGSVRRCIQSTRLLLYTEVRKLKVDHRPAFLSYESCSRDFFKKISHHC